MDIGALITGLTALISFIALYNSVTRDPIASVRDESHEKEKKFMTDLHNSQMENLKYQKKIVEELSKISGVLSVQGVKVEAMIDEVDELKKDVKELNVDVALLKKDK